MQQGRSVLSLTLVAAHAIVGCGGKTQGDGEVPAPHDGGTPGAEGAVVVPEAGPETAALGDDGGVGPATISTLASGQSVAQAIALDSTFVYFSTNLDGAIQKVPVSGGPTTTLATATGFIGALAVQGPYLYSRATGSCGSPSPAASRRR